MRIIKGWHTSGTCAGGVRGVLVVVEGVLDLVDDS